MDRIDSMELAELRKATRALFNSLDGALLPREFTWTQAGKDITAALAAFDPTPLDVAKAALEKAGLEPVVAGDAAEGDILIRAYGREGEAIWFRAKDPA